MDKVAIKRISILLDLILIFSVLVSLAGFIRDYQNTQKYGGVDLRVRITSARALSQGIEPYFYKWKEGDSQRLLTPSDNPKFPTNHISETPAFLAILAPVAHLPYKFLRNVWFVMEWILLLLSIGLLASVTKSDLKIKAIVIFGLLFIGGSHLWRFHVERGQAKIIFVFLISLAFWLSQRPFKFHLFWSGFLTGFTAALRLPGLFMLIPMAICRKWQLLVGSLSGLVVGVLSPLMFSGISVWEKYFYAMKIQAKIYLKLTAVDTCHYPRLNIEGMINLSDYLTSRLTEVDSSFNGVLRNFLGIYVTPAFLFYSLVLTMIFLSLIIFYIRFKNVTLPSVFLVGIALVFLSEFFLPAPRYSYSNVLWLLPMALIILQSRSWVSILYPLFILLINVGLSVSLSWKNAGSIAGNFLVLFYVLGAGFFFLIERRSA